MSKLKTIITTPDGVDLIRVRQPNNNSCKGCYFSTSTCTRPEQQRSTYQTKFYCEKVVFGIPTSFIYIEA